MNEALNREYIESQYLLWKTAPERLPEDWRYFFEGFEMGLARSQTPVCDEAALARQARVEALVHRYRDMGHMLACMDPLTACPISHPLLEPAALGIGADEEDLPVRFAVSTFSGTTTIRDLVKALKDTYCRTIGVEYMHLQNPEEREWLQGRMEPSRNRTALDGETRKRILRKLLEADSFERFLNKTYVGVTRFSIEGADTLVPVLDRLCSRAAAGGCGEVILGMAHRGRLNVLAHIFEKPYEDIFIEFEHCYDPAHVSGYGDVKYHNGYLNDITHEGHPLRLFMVPNPSHLEAVDPVVEGIARARQDALGSVDLALPVLIHGDAAFAGQGIVAEVLNMSQLEGYRTGGTLHIVVNNQIGYTTLPADARSSRYATDVAKGIMAPIFHVHGEDPEAACYATTLALDYRNRFHKDVVIDLVCYRRHGHNEGDDPYFTQPQMVERIRSRPTVAAVYEEVLRQAGVIEAEEVSRQREDIGNRLDAAYQSVHGTVCAFPQPRFYEHLQEQKASANAPGAMPVSEDQLLRYARTICTVPEGFMPPPKLVALLQKRLQAMETDTGIDWAFAETLAFASLLDTGISVRLSGQDVRRGTFSQRHCALTDIHTEKRIFPLQAVARPPAVFQAFDSLLAEPSVLGFEYGYSLLRPDCLTIWEAQFGDFVNNAQSIIDLFIASGETKWHQQSPLVVLLPHGLEGLGPEHSSARPERLLQLCAGNNIQVCQPTTPAQFFHLLRGQATGFSDRKPLFVLTPKSLLRAAQAVSRREAFAGGSFEDVLVDGPGGKTERVLLCSGKIAYELIERCKSRGRDDVAIVRMERLYPFDGAAFAAKTASISSASRWFWVQDEPENMGAYRFMAPLIEAIIGQKLRYAGRDASPSPATGYPRVFKMEQEAVFEKALA
ncbi:2-oxoglutarate dehydrogenase E1 component [Desulfatirhabdium butyrativorans]|uniref:2-oxoglutarate dehydrogenase E1 component n=1 Tax=Desulfatirhabdium butyrativorans TaxID=340467 RepID=UPI00040B9A44|nr:2-oxoglutarate dehydrogenase E1 component [Desulfatirhabdium butyrativorans]